MVLYIKPFLNLVMETHKDTSQGVKAWVVFRLALGSDYAYGLTLEADINFPSFFTAKDKFNRDFYTASLFGMYTVDTGSADSKNGCKYRLGIELYG